MFEAVYDKMLVTKTFTETINITAINSALSNFRTILTSHLRRRYVGKCHKSVFVVEILEIIRHSPCLIQTTNLSGDGYVNVEFNALVTVVMPGDIVNNVVIYDSNSKLVRGNSDTDGSAEVIIAGKGSNITGVLRNEQIVSVIVKKTDYSPNRDKFTIIGVPVECETKMVLYKVTGKLPQKMYDNLKLIIDNIAELMQTRTELMELNENALMRMEKVIYSYPEFGAVSKAVTDTKSKKWSGPTPIKVDREFEIVDIIEVMSDVNAVDFDFTGLWGRDLSLIQSSPFVSKHSGNLSEYTSKGTITIIDATTSQMVIAVLKSIYNYLKYINENATSFSKQTTFDEHKNVWMSMAQTKIT